MMTTQNINLAPCPQCQSQMFFSPDGRFRICDRCGHKQVIEKEQQSPQELAKTQRMSAGESNGFVHIRDSGVRELLGQGIACV